jgi:plastocyanin
VRVQSDPLVPAETGPALVRRGRACALAVTILLLPPVAGCGGGGGPSTPTPTPDNPNRIVISSAGTVAPAEIVVPLGSRVLFVNNDSRRHDMVSDPHPEHSLCEEINVGVLLPTQSRETRNLVIPRTCTYHDHENPDAAGLLGRIVIK